MNSKSWIVVVVEAILFLAILGTYHSFNSNKIDVLENNIIGYKDRIEQVELENGDLMAIKQSLILSEEAAREELDMTKSEMKELKRKLDSKVAQINRLEMEISVKDTIELKPDTVYVALEGSKFTKSFVWHDDWAYLRADVFGKTIQDSQMKVYNFKMNVPITFGIANDYKVFASTSNPNVILSDMTAVTVYGSTVYPKKKRIQHGISAGFGLQYGLLGKKLDIGPQAGYSVMWVF